MKGFLKKAKAELEGIFDPNSNPQSSTPPAQQPFTQQTNSEHLKGMALDDPSNIREPSAIDILRYRYHHGTNLGSVYVIEKWLSASRFPENASGTSELEAGEMP